MSAKQVSIKSCINLEELEARAGQILPAASFDYYRGGAGDESTLRENREAYRRIKLRPRMLRDVSKIKKNLTIFDRELSTPIMVAPMAFQMLAHKDGELATARAAASRKTLMTVSTLSTCSLEEVREASDFDLWFQLYVYKDREITRDLVSRAEASGYKALVVTVDSPVLGKREKDIKNRFDLPANLTVKNLTLHNLEKFPDTGDDSGLSTYIASIYDRSLTYKDLSWIASLTNLPVLVKGVLRADDALQALDSGARGIVVSNHGGRQLDTAVSTIEALPEVVEAVNGRAPIIVDGGIRRGTDVLKAIAFGASAVYVGRPVLWGLALDGKEGVEMVLDLINEEFENAMTLAGATSLEEVTRDLIFQSRGEF